MIQAGLISHATLSALSSRAVADVEQTHSFADNQTLTNDCKSQRVSTQHAKMFEGKEVLRGDSWFQPHCTDHLLVLVSIPQAVTPSHPRVTDQGILLQGSCAPFSDWFSEVEISWVRDFSRG